MNPEQERAAEERIILALRAVEGLSTEVLRDLPPNNLFLHGVAAIQTCKRIGIEIDTGIRGDEDGV